ncbi:MAG TPA: hypothetical protein VJ697_13065 [Nitrososphaeraceae archaeon]|nr:hypothetical protein [Nitrososphaeraceae archaeon]
MNINNSWSFDSKELLLFNQQQQNSIYEHQSVKVQNVQTEFNQQQQQQQYPINQNIKTYDDKKYGIKFEYPSNVDVVEDRFMTMSDLQLLHAFFEGQFRSPYLTIKIYELTQEDKTLENFTSRIIKIKEAPGGLVNSNVSILRSEPTILAGKPAHELEYAIENLVPSGNNTGLEKNKTMNLSIWTINENYNQAYELEFTGTVEKYKKHLPSAKEIIKSFQFSN